MPFTRENVAPEVFFSKSDPQDQLRFLLQFAILAPSSYNTQPWLFRVHNTTVEIWGDKRKALPESDANHRQMFLSLGAALENLLIAADYYGWPVKVDYFPEIKELFFMARVIFEGTHYNAAQVDHFPHLFFAIPRRHTNRNLYENRPVLEDFLTRVQSFATRDLKIFFIHEDEAKSKASTIVGDATYAAFSNPEFKKELSHWMKPSLSRYREGIPGYNLGIPWLLSFVMPFLMRTCDVRNTQKKMVQKLLRETPIFCVIATETDEPADWVRAGQTYERIALMATAEDIKTAPFAAPIQIDNYYQKLQELLTTMFRPQMFFRLGYCEKISKPSPRRNIEEVITI